MNIETERFMLESISPALAGRIVARDQTTDDNWHPEYPFEDELVPLAGLAATSSPDPVFTMYLIRRNSDLCAIGGFGFFGPPDDTGQGSSVTVSLHQSEVQVLLPRPSVELLKLLLSAGHFPPQRMPTFTNGPHNECSKKLACSKHLTMKPKSTSAAHSSKQSADSATVASSLRSFDSGSRFSRWLPAGYRIQSDGGTVAA